jgi:hypothetical protein
MLTFFATAKPFDGHDGIIQRNALQSWKKLHPQVEVILFGNEPGAAEVCRDLGLRHEPEVERHEGKCPYVNAMFLRAQQIAQHEFLCYSNCDIIFSDDFLRAFEKAKAWNEHFLLVGRRWDSDIEQAIDFDDPKWAVRLQEAAVTKGERQSEDFVDFFLFQRGLYDDIPPLVVGYSYWDHWMVWKALSKGAEVVDASAFMVPVHQNHEYRTTPERVKGSFTDRNAMRNRELSGNGMQLRSIADATYVMRKRGIQKNVRRHWMRFARKAPGLAHFLRMTLWSRTKTFLLDVSQPVRTLLGLRSDPVRRLREKV